MMLTIDTRLVTVDFSTARIALSNVVFRPTAGVSYLQASMTSLVSKALTLGTDVSIGGPGYMLRWDGVYQVEAVWPEDAGADGCYQMQQKLLRLFPRGLTLTTGDGLLIRFDTASLLPARADGAWWRGPVRCPWWCLEET
jgi:Bacteriophage related domain of unknown function